MFRCRSSSSQVWAKRQFAPCLQAESSGLNCLCTGLYTYLQGLTLYGLEFRLWVVVEQASTSLSGTDCSISAASEKIEASSLIVSGFAVLDKTRMSYWSWSSLSLPVLNCSEKNLAISSNWLDIFPEDS